MKEIDHRRADLNLLVVFQKLLVERHVGRAAKRLGLTQSAASHALGQLRIMFGDPLFVRHPKGIEPTSRAHALAPIVVDILDRANSMLASPGWFDPSKPHTFTIGGTDLAVFTVLVPLIKRLRATAPKVNLRVRSLDSTRVVAAFDRQEIDCALMPFPEARARITREPAIKESFVGIARRGHLALSVSKSRPGIGRRSRTSSFNREEKIPVGQMSIWRSWESNEGSSRWSRTSCRTVDCGAQRSRDAHHRASRSSFCQGARSHDIRAAGPDARLYHRLSCQRRASDGFRASVAARSDI